MPTAVLSYASNSGNDRYFLTFFSECGEERLVVDIRWDSFCPCCGPDDWGYDALADYVDWPNVAIVLPADIPDPLYPYEDAGILGVYTPEHPEWPTVANVWSKLDIS